MSGNVEYQKEYQAQTGRKSWDSHGGERTRGPYQREKKGQKEGGTIGTNREIIGRFRWSSQILHKYQLEDRKRTPSEKTKPKEKLKERGRDTTAHHKKSSEGTTSLGKKQRFRPGCFVPEPGGKVKSHTQQERLRAPEGRTRAKRWGTDGLAKNKSCFGAESFEEECSRRGTKKPTMQTAPKESKMSLTGTLPKNPTNHGLKDMGLGGISKLWTSAAQKLNR